MDARALPSPDTLVADLLAGRRDTLSRLITWLESTREDHQQLAQAVLHRALPHSGNATRVGISGVPGVGKSTFIEALGLMLLERGLRVAVLAIDPSSQRSGGSILGDKTRMAQLSLDERAYIRPSPTSGHLGGVNRVTRESMLLCEAAGFDVVLVETVGVGQSETVVADMVDCYLVLMLPSAGDELQGIKKGVLELADIIAVNKADAHLEQSAREAAAAYSRALAILQPTGSWKPVARTCSAVTGSGLDALWGLVESHREMLSSNGELDSRRGEQQVRWLWAQLEYRLLQRLRGRQDIDEKVNSLEHKVRSGTITVSSACDALLKLI